MRHPHSIAVQVNTSDHPMQSPNAVSVSSQRRSRWAVIETLLGKWHVFPWGIQQLYSRPSVGVVLGQR